MSIQTLYMIRHSLTEGNEKHQYYGATDLPLTDNGIQICRERVGQISLLPDTAFATTGLTRTRQTLALLFGDVPFDEYPELREMEQGIFEGHTYQELIHVPAYIEWIEDTSGDYVIPDGESRNAFRSRIIEGLESLIMERNGSLMLVCHAGTISTAMLHWFPDPEKNMYSWNSGPCGGYAVHFNDGIPCGWETI